MNVLITGVAGFIGSHLCGELLKEGHRIIGIDNFDGFYNKAIKKKNIAPYEGNVTFIEEDLENKTQLIRSLPKDIDVVVHLAAKAGVRPSLQNPLDYVDSNVKGTVSLLEIMREKGIKNLVFSSSSSVYGKSRDIPFREDALLGDEISVYAASKRSCEIFIKMYHNLYQLNAINLRFFTVYGEGQRPDLAIHKFLKANYLGETITLFGNGQMARDYTYVKDTIQGVIGAIKRVSSNSDICETYNIGNSHPVSLTSLIASIEKVTGKTV